MSNYAQEESQNSIILLDERSSARFGHNEGHSGDSEGHSSQEEQESTDESARGRHQQRFHFRPLEDILLLEQSKRLIDSY